MTLCAFCYAEGRFDRDPETIVPQGTKLGHQEHCERCLLHADAERYYVSLGVDVEASWSYDWHRSGGRWFPLEELL